MDKNITIDRPKNYTKRVVSHQIVPGKIKPNEKTTLSFKVGYKDNSLHKFLLEENFEAKDSGDKYCRKEVKVKDFWGNEFKKIYKIKFEKEKKLFNKNLF